MPDADRFSKGKWAEHFREDTATEKAEATRREKLELDSLGDGPRPPAGTWRASNEAARAADSRNREAAKTEVQAVQEQRKETAVQDQDRLAPEREDKTRRSVEAVENENDDALELEFEDPPVNTATDLSDNTNSELSDEQTADNDEYQRYFDKAEELDYNDGYAKGIKDTDEEHSF